MVRTELSPRINPEENGTDQMRRTVERGRHKSGVSIVRTAQVRGLMLSAVPSQPATKFNPTAARAIWTAAGTWCESQQLCVGGGIGPWWPWQPPGVVPEFIGIDIVAGKNASMSMSARIDAGPALRITTLLMMPHGWLLSPESPASTNRLFNTNIESTMTVT